MTDDVYVSGYSISDKPITTSTTELWVGEWSGKLTFRKIMFIALFALLVYAVVEDRQLPAVAVAIVMAVMAWRGDR